MIIRLSVITHFMPGLYNTLTRWPAILQLQITWSTF